MTSRETLSIPCNPLKNLPPRPYHLAAFLVLLWGLHRFRLHQIAQQFNARLAERTRIARELHDTLLQSFHG